jgi:hypothetical protein
MYCVCIVDGWKLFIMDNTSHERAADIYAQRRCPLCYPEARDKDMDCC